MMTKKSFFAIYSLFFSAAVLLLFGLLWGVFQYDNLFFWWVITPPLQVLALVMAIEMYKCDKNENWHRYRTITGLMLLTTFLYWGGLGIFLIIFGGFLLVGVQAALVCFVTSNIKKTGYALYEYDQPKPMKPILKNFALILMVALLLFAYIIPVVFARFTPTGSGWI